MSTKFDIYVLLTKLNGLMNLLEPYQQAYTYDTGNNLTNLSHQANSSAWQQILTIHPNNNHGTETQHQNQVLWMMLYNHLKWCHTHQ
jgi:hypothetical protein